MMLFGSFFAGCVLGILYTLHLWRDVRGAVLNGRAPLGWGVALRLSGVAVTLLLVTLSGGPDLLAAVAGLIVARTVLVRRIGGIGHA